MTNPDAMVSYIDPQLNQATRTARIRVEVPSPGGSLRLGMYADVRLEAGTGASSLIVPASAVQKVGDRDVVYLVDPHEPRRFIEREVRLGRGTADRHEVRSSCAPRRRRHVDDETLVQRQGPAGVRLRHGHAARRRRRRVAGRHHVCGGLAGGTGARRPRPAASAELRPADAATWTHAPRRYVMIGSAASSLDEPRTHREGAGRHAGQSADARAIPVTRDARSAESPPREIVLAVRGKPQARRRHARCATGDGLPREAAGFVNVLPPRAHMQTIQPEMALASEALNALSAHIAVLDARGLIIFVNAAWARFARCNGGVCGADAYVGTNYLGVCRQAVDCGDADARPALDGVEGVLRGDREGYTLEYPCSSPDQERWFRMSVTRFAAGGEPCAVVSHQDITAERQGRRATEDAERLLRSVIESLPVGVWILDSRGRIVQGNAAGLQIWGGARYVGPERFGEYKGWWLSTGEPIEPEDWAAARAIARGETSIDEEVEIECFDGTHKIILNSAVPLFDSERRIAGAIIVNQDITPRKRAEAERGRMLWEHERLRAAAQEANRMKDDFIATLSHELRTPLQSVLGWTTILKRTLGGDRHATARAADAIERNARLSVRLVNETLDLSRIGRGKLQLETSDVDFIALVGEVLDIIRPAAIEKGMDLETRVEGARAVVHGDPTRLQQIVWNLLTNALKFTHPGGRVEVRARIVDGEVELAVQDTGAGIAPEFLPFVFDRYRQAADGRPAAQPGLGLGLSIVKELVALHGGTIAADSPGEGHGATFTLRLPLAPER